MRKGLIILFLLLVIAFGLIGYLKEESNQNLHIETHVEDIIIDYF
ncbi:hypothetical protein SAMN04488134_1214 [Amphibacillus marinus]|uniref:Uncharacterized protein n=1 Tax=Amphibacillus marinus TaxID=872970 RepID=A0A1H8MMI7_9BACI|nr:hypothetical protein [Amphibacillus marinus]SEO18490.1 hypothetical protein SAMN04488134_104211 [Amphibacillus marinus]SEO95301.1 hypothetical protein SAMN04488134_1214 [Amphibacillus marinus]